jgi:inorganic phosphate transporter, PiT family
MTDAVPSWLLLATALGFAAVNGLNDGASLLSAALRGPVLRPLVAVGLLAAALVATPILLGTAVATTLAGRLVRFEGDGGNVGIVVAVATTVAVVGVLSRLGLPTSLTLALVGAITGAGIGLGMPVSYGVLGVVIAAGLAAPLVGGVGGWLVSVAAGRRRRHGDALQRIRRLHVGGFSAQCLAYGANDGQKMLAVYAVAMGSAGDVRLDVAQLALLTVVFTVGLLAGIRRVARTLLDDVLLVRPAHAVAAEVSSAGAVLASAAVGAPVSMTQSLTGGLVGAGIAESYLRVRWRAAGRLLLAWVVTLPASLMIAALLARSLAVALEGPV